MNLFSIFKKKTPIKVGCKVKFSARCGTLTGNVKRDIGDLCLVETYNWGSRMTQWIDKKNLTVIES